MPKSVAQIRKPEILRAAFRAIIENGLAAPSYDAIAQAGGISRQLIRHYFPDPEELVLGLCDMLAAAYRDRMMQGIIAAESTERLPLFLDFYFGLLEGQGLEKPADDQVYDAVLAMAAGSGRIRRNLHEQYALLRHTIAHEVQISHPSLPQPACREIAYLFVSMMYGHWKMVASLGFSADHSRVARAAMDRIIASYLESYDDPDGT